MRNSSGKALFPANLALILFGATGITAFLSMGYLQDIFDARIRLSLEKALDPSIPAPGIRSEIDNILADRANAKTTLLAAVVISTGIIVILLSRSNRVLNNVVSLNSRDLQIANIELTKKNKQLQMHGKMQQEFINIAAHELRTPVQPLIGMVDMIQQELAAGKQEVALTKAEAEIVTRNVMRLEKLSTDILTATQIEGGAFKLVREEFDMVKNVRELVDAIRSSVPATRIDIIIKQADAMVNADKRKINYVISNLVENAIEFTREGGRIFITVDHDEPHNSVIVQVTDTGCGIDPTVLPRLFSKFSTRADSGGIGLGLYISKFIVDSHGGAISGHNNENDKGASFAFKLPLLSLFKPNQISESKLPHWLDIFVALRLAADKAVHPTKPADNDADIAVAGLS